MTNVVSYIGYLGRDAETINVGSATVTKFSVGNTEHWKKQDGTKGQRTTWVRFQWWNCNITELLKKGRYVAIVGKIAADQFETKDGQKRTDTYVRVDELTLLDRSPNATASVSPTEKSSWDDDGGALTDGDEDETLPWA